MSIKGISFHSFATDSVDTNVKKQVSMEQLERKELKHEEQNIKITKEKLEEVVQGMNNFLSPTTTSLKFELHDELNNYYVKVVDANTQEVIREIPSKKLLDIYASMTEFLGLAVDKKV